MADEYRYFEKDGPYFRKRADTKAPPVDEVRHGSEWVPFMGDRYAPVCFGSEVSEGEANGGGDEPPKAPTPGTTVTARPYPASFDYFRHEGNIFRREKSVGTLAAYQVRRGNRWKDYEGDALAPAH